MKTYCKFDLYTKNTMRLHCIAEKVYEPETIDELKELVVMLKDSGETYHLLGAGSNVILPNSLFSPVILLTSISNDILIDKNTVECGCSVRIQKLIRECQRKELGGLEYLYSVPCNVGGAVYMNAGAGRNQISDYIERIEYYSPTKGTVEFIEKSNADFSYRHSIFQQNDWIILRIRFSLPSATYSEVEDRVKSRIKFANEKQAGNLPSCGSVFSQCNGHIMQLLMGLRIGGACWSKKTRNWISNLGGAKSKDICRLIGIARFLHIITLQKYSVEVRIWK